MLGNTSECWREKMLAILQKNVGNSRKMLAMFSKNVDEKILAPLRKNVNEKKCQQHFRKILTKNAHTPENC
jgi:hypothetical protein